MHQREGMSLVRFVKLLVGEDLPHVSYLRVPNHFREPMVKDATLVKSEAE